MKRFLFFFVFCLSALYAKPLQIDVHAKSAILINMDTGAVLFEKNANLPSFPASITKIATALYVLDVKHPNLSEIATVSADSVRVFSKKEKFSAPYWLEFNGTKMGLAKGEEVSIESLLYGMMLVSGNDAANVLAETLGGSIPGFISEMNQYLASIGCLNTYFVNPHGLHQPEHMTTAYDMGVIARKAMSNAKFREIVSTLDYLKPATNKHPEEHIKQYNHLQRPGRYFYPKAIGIKTGSYASYAKKTLVAAAKQDERALIAVLLGCETEGDRYQDAISLFETAFAEQKVRRLIFSGNESYNRSVEGAKSVLQAGLTKEIAIEYYPAEEPVNLKAQICWKIPALPIRKGDAVAQMQLVDGKGNIISSAPLIAKEEVKSSFFYTLKKILKIK